jgi:hypothetical protein
MAPEPGTRSLTDTPAPVRQLGYFERSGPIRLILGSFFFLTLPVAGLVLFLPQADKLAWLYFWLFGGTHIVITLTIYGSRANRQYFTNSLRNRVIFFGVPTCILAAFTAVYSTNLATNLPWLALIFWAGVRFMNFFHLNRQTFGVLQLFKARAKGKFPAWAKRCENGTGLALVAALMVTHASGGICPFLFGTVEPLYGVIAPVQLLQLLWLACMVIATGLFTASLVALVRTRPANGYREPLLYFAFQFIGTAAATIFLPLYLAALAIHYVEYHTLMVPRIAAQKLDESHRIDRGYGWLRARPLGFIVVILGLSALVTTGMNSMNLDRPGSGGAAAWGMLLTAFDALVVCHYFLEMFIWKFSDPHFRKSMDGVYFAPKPSVLRIAQD